MCGSIKRQKPFSRPSPQESSGCMGGLLDRLFGGHSCDTACHLPGRKVQMTAAYSGGAGDSWDLRDGGGARLRS